MATTQLIVPDIGDFKDVEIIELLVKPGDTIAPEQSLITIESDKASMEIPASAGGKLVSLAVKLGDKVSQGSVIGEVEAAGDADEGGGKGDGGKAAPAAREGEPAGKAEAAPSADAAPKSAPTTGAQGGAAPATPSGSPAAGSKAGAPASGLAGTIPQAPPGEYDCDMVVIGGGPGGYSAAFRAADLGMSVMLVERYPTLGGVCLNVGCIPSKALLHAAAVVDEARSFAAHGIEFGKPKIDLDALRGWKDKVVGKLTGGLTGMAKARKVTVVRGYASFTGPYALEVDETTGSGQDRSGNKRPIRFRQAIIAAGSQAVKLPFLPDDPRIVDSTGALLLSGKPKRMLVIGGGIIGLEMGTVYAALGAKLDVVEMLDGLMAGADRDLVRVWLKFAQPKFDKIMLKTKTVKAEAVKSGIKVWFEGEQAPAEPQVYDLVLSAVGRSANGNKIGCDKVGVEVNERAFIPVDSQMRTNVPHIYAIGDVIGNPMLAHKAVHEAHVAAEAAAGHKRYFDARVIPSVAYTDPEVAWVGITEDEAKANGVKVGKAVFPWAASGRAIANGRDEGFTKLIVDEKTHRVIGGAIVGTHAGDLIGELALAVEMGADPSDIAHTIHPHPTLGESMGMVAEVYEGVCTDLPPVRKR